MPKTDRKARSVPIQVAMRVFLRNTRTGLLYAGPESWTDQQAEALDFERADRAIDAAASARLNSMEVLMAFDEPSFEIPLKIVGFGQ
jgi:hypothetical protein